MTIPINTLFSFPVCGDTDRTLSSILCRLRIYFISTLYNLKSVCIIFLIKMAMFFHIAINVAAPVELLTLLAVTLIGRTHL
jgi:hypothetical protein